MADTRRNGTTPLTDDRDKGSGPPNIPNVEALVRIDNGGVCAVFRGRQAGGGRGVAVKVLPAPFDRWGWSAFEREQNRLRRLTGLSTVLQIDRVGTLDDGRPYLVSELCAESCEQRVEIDGALLREGVVDLGAEMSDALARIHALGVVHGAVTPHNVLFRRSGQAVLADSGVAARQAYQGDLDYIGEYAAPETLQSGAVDERSDLYGLGCILFLAIMGRPPFPARIGEHSGERVLRVMAEPAPSVDPDVAGADLAHLIDELLATDPEMRPIDAGEVADRLAAMAAQIPRQSETPPHVVAPIAASSQVPTGAPQAAASSPQAGPATPQGDMAQSDRAAADPAPVASDRLADLVAMSAGGPAASETSTDWSDLLDDVLCETGSGDSPRRRGAARPTWTEPSLTRVPAQPSSSPGEPDDPSAELSVDLATGGPAPTSRRTARRAYTDRPPRSRSRTLTMLGGVAAAGVLLIGVVDLVGSDGSADATRDGAAGSPASPAPTATSAATGTTAPGVEPVSANQTVRLLSARSSGKSVQVRWTGDERFEFAVLVWQPGRASSVVFADHRTSVRIAIASGRPYCFRVQATAGDRVVESGARGIRGATCR